MQITQDKQSVTRYTRRLLPAGFSLCLLAGGGYFLLRWSGGMPPLPWLLLVTALSHLSQLWQARGNAILLPLTLLILHSLFLLAAWISFCFCAYTAILSLFPLPTKSPVQDLSADLEQEKMKASTQDYFAANAVVIEKPARAPEQTRITPEEYIAPRVPPVEEPQTLADHPTEEPQQRDKRLKEEAQQAPIAAQLTLRTAARLHTGREKRHMLNENRLFAQQWPATFHALPQPCGLFIVAACSGPFAGGVEANQQIIQALSDTIIPALANGEDAEQLTRHLLQSVQDAIFTAQLNSAVAIEIGVSVVLVMGQAAYCVQRGKSRSYLYHEAKDTLSILDNPAPKPGTTPNEQLLIIPLEPGLRLLLCSDGLWEMVPEDELAYVMRHHGYRTALTVDTLITSAVQHGGKNNISAIMVALEQEKIEEKEEEDIFDGLFDDGWEQEQ